jgi:hypothetical protein
LRPTTILETRRPRMHPHRPRRHNPPRYGSCHRDRPCQGSPLHRKKKKNSINKKQAR